MSHFIIVSVLISLLGLSNQTNCTIANNSKACLYGWQLSENGSTCSINCFIDKYGYINADCNLYVLTKLKTSYNDMTLYMSPGKRLTNSSQLSYCYNVTLNSQQFSLTPDGQLDLGNRYIQISIFNLSKVKESVTFCYPLSPQLLQCTNDVTDYGNYLIINSTKLHIPSKNITTYLGDFYILNNGSAVTCHQNIKNNIDIPRCNYITVKPDDIHLNSDGSVLIISANFTIKNPIYSIITSNYEVQVCFPISLEMLNCDHSLEKVGPYYDLSPNLDAYSEDFGRFVEPDNYISATYTITFCNETFDDTQSVNSLKIYAIAALVEGTILLIIIGFRHQYFLQNYHCKCLMCHLITLSTFYFFDTVRTFFPSNNCTPCYLAFSFYYFVSLSVVAWLSIISYDSWRNISKLQTVRNCRYSISCIKLKMKTRFLMYCVYAWGIPAVLLTIVLTIDLTSSPLNFHNPYIPHIEWQCVFITKFGYGIYWCIPLGLYIAIICIFIFLTIWNLKQAASGTEVVNQQINMQIFLMSVRIVFVLSSSWVVSYIINILPLFNWKFAATSLNVGFYCGVLQGYFLAFVYCPKRKILDKIRNGIAEFRRRRELL
ncbi:hypothetical protein CHUAL_011151 [Chamberlinius hualienensis]